LPEFRRENLYWHFKEELTCKKNKYSLCGRTGRVYPVEVQIPYFSNGIVKKDRNVCTNYPEAIHKAYLRYRREGVDEEGRMQWDEHVHEH
jgi:F420H2 dehydrogenase subunit O